MATAEIPARTEPIVDPDMLYEVVGGKVVEKVMSLRETRIAFLLGFFIEAHASTRGLGRAFVESMFRIKSDAERDRRPDVAFVSAERWPLDRDLPEGEALDLAPDLAVEVVSPTDRARDLDRKIDQYLLAGVKEVWTIWRDTAKVVVHSATTTSRIHRRGDVLDGGTLLPGFRLPVSDLLPEPSEVDRGG